ncbi:MAG: hypothetical protein K8L91_03000 [Anaerolineae bacterium]|nr:hypothetical protein [Anaerolineae bacterium]
MEKVISRLFKKLSTYFSSEEWHGRQLRKERASLDYRHPETAYWKEITGEKESQYREATQNLLIRKYNFSHHEHVLSRQEALRFLDELAEIGIGLLGASGWFYFKLTPTDCEDIRKRLLEGHSPYVRPPYTIFSPDGGCMHLGEDYEFDFSVPAYSEIEGTDEAKESIEAVRSYIQKLPEKVEYVSFNFDFPTTWDDMFPPR